MKSIIGLSSEASTTIKSAWQWIDSQVSAEELPEDLRLPFRLCFQTAVCELISRYYIDDLQQDEFIEHYTYAHIEDVLRALFEYDTDNTLLNGINEAIDNFSQEDNTFWALVTSHYLKSRVVGEDAKSEQWDDHDGLIEALTTAMATVIEMALECFQIVPHLASPPAHLSVDNVEVKLSSHAVIIWS